MQMQGIVQTCSSWPLWGAGKTTALRDAARILSSDPGRRVVAVDTSGEIAGWGRPTSLTGTPLECKMKPVRRFINLN